MMLHTCKRSPPSQGPAGQLLGNLSELLRAPWEPLRAPRRQTIAPRRPQQSAKTASSGPQDDFCLAGWSAAPSRPAPGDSGRIRQKDDAIAGPAAGRRAREAPGWRGGVSIAPPITVPVAAPAAAKEVAGTQGGTTGPRGQRSRHQLGETARRCKRRRRCKEQTRVAQGWLPGRREARGRSAAEGRGP